MKNLPVFVFPVSLEFYLGARHTYKQLLTLYNPYDFVVNFRVLCTSPNKFTVIDPEGVISPQSCIDIVVRYIQPTLTHCSTAEKFRITMTDSNNQILGKRDIPSKLIEGEPKKVNTAETDNASENFHSLSSRVAASEHPAQPDEYPFHTIHARLREQHPINIVAATLSLFCLITIFLPTQQEIPVASSLPPWLHVSVNVKLIFAFMLGLVFKLLLKQ